MKPIILLILLLLSPVTVASNMATQCPDDLNHSFRKLHSNEAVNICDLYTGEPMLFVNTASYCGFTPQLKELEALHQKYHVDRHAKLTHLSGLLALKIDPLILVHSEAFLGV